MVDIYKNMNRLFLSLLCMLFLCSPELLTISANASVEKIGQIEDKNFQRPVLRGEVWYGTASWYGPRFHGKKTSSGEKFNKHELTAAHKFLPFNTQVLVTNLNNNKRVVVRINDRGPFKPDRIIDLSEEAAGMLDAKKQGLTYVRVQVLRNS